jgi:hypothetical protein
MNGTSVWPVHPWKQWNPIMPSKKKKGAMRAIIWNHKYRGDKTYRGSKYSRLDVSMMPADVVEQNKLVGEI